MSTRSFWARLASSGLLVGVLIAAIACGEKEVVVTQVVEKSVEKVIQQTVVVEKEKIVEKQVEKVVQQTVVVEKPVEKVVQQTVVVEKEKIVEKLVVATPTPGTAARPGKQPEGTLTVAMSDVGTPLFLNRAATWPLNLYHTGFGLTETLAKAKGQGEEPMLAEGWTMAADQSKVTFKIRKGVTFAGKDRNWGEMTAEDVVWSFNDAGAENAGSKHDQADVIGLTYLPWKVVDQYTVEAPFKQFQGSWLAQTIIEAGGGANIVSKKVFAEKGDAALTTMVGTGPFVAEKWSPDERLVAIARTDHWRILPDYRRLVVMEAPETLTRVAMMRTGEAIIAEVPLKEAPGLKNLGYVPDDRVGVATGQNVYFAGNYWSKKDPRTGASVTRSGFKPDASHPWIGDPDDPARMESARKVRLAMSMAIDRKTINDTILAGLGGVVYIGQISAQNPEWKDKWKIDYDPAGAKALLAEAGYPGGFSFKFFIPPDLGSVDPEVGKAIASFWQQIGLKPQLETTSYSARRPSMVAREIDIPWLMQGSDRGAPVGGPTCPFCFPQPGWNGGYEAQEFYDFWKASSEQVMGSPANLATRDQFYDYMFKWQLQIGTVEIPKLFVYDGRRVASWQLERNTQSAINGLDSVVLK